MDRTNGRIFVLYLMGLIGLIGGITLAKGGLFVDRHEGDVLHLIEIVLRMAEGQWPHIDFVTPLGILSFAPIWVFVEAGFGVGISILLAQIGFALLMIFPIWWLARTRFSQPLAYASATLIILLCLALIHGEGAPHVSLSMHYNRWAWALAFISIALAVLPPKKAESSWIDGAIIGLCAGLLVLIKVTYVVAFAPGIILALCLRKDWGALGAAVLAALSLLGVFTLIIGGAFWPAYVDDLLLVSSTEIRPRAGESLSHLIIAPDFIIGNAALAAAIVFLRKGDGVDLGLMLIGFAPGFIYVTFQNYGNDPKWLALVALVLFAAARTTRLKIVAIVCAALIAPSFINMAVSPVRHLLLDRGQFTPTFDGSPNDDFLTITHRVYRTQMRSPKIYETQEFASLNGLADHKPPVEFRGEILPSCLQELGLIGTLKAVAHDLDAAGLSKGKSLFAADTFGGYWMFGDLKPTQGGAPWYYGALSGFEQADYLLVPLCTTTPRAFRAILSDISDTGVELREIRRTELYLLYEKLSR